MTREETAVAMGTTVEWVECWEKLALAKVVFLMSGEEREIDLRGVVEVRKCWCGRARYYRQQVCRWHYMESAEYKWWRAGHSRNVQSHPSIPAMQRLEVSGPLKLRRIGAAEGEIP